MPINRTRVWRVRRPPRLGPGYRRVTLGATARPSAIPADLVDRVRSPMGYRSARTGHRWAIPDHRSATREGTLGQWANGQDVPAGGHSSVVVVDGSAVGEVTGVAEGASSSVPGGEGSGVGEGGVSGFVGDDGSGVGLGDGSGAVDGEGSGVVGVVPPTDGSGVVVGGGAGAPTLVDGAPNPWPARAAT